jgi:crotonobetainyl-CoA:carnitine CoA-transferase CaiB-like acyl-CoA transferase
MPAGALAGIKVLELATMVAGPYCGKLLGDLGADVVKVESPQGDPARRCGPFPESGPDPERSALFLYNNTSKRGITLDLDVAESLDPVERLLQWADLLIDGLPSGRLEGLGLTLEAMHRLNPALVCTSIAPYGRTGPRAAAKGDELTLMHAAGLGNLLPTRAADVDRAPVRMGGHAVGYHGGLTAALASMAALWARRERGKGRAVDVSLQEAILALVRPNVSGSRYHGTTWSRVPDRPPVMGRMQTRDGYIVVGTPEDHHFRAFRELMGNPEWIAGSQWETLEYRTHHLMDVAPKLDEWMRRQSKHDIHQKGAEEGIAVGPIHSAPEVLADPQLAARGYFTEVEHSEAGKQRYAGWPYRMSATPPRVSRPAPLLGQHNREVYCSELGYSAAEFEQLRRVGAA